MAAIAGEEVIQNGCAAESARGGEAEEENVAREHSSESTLSVLNQ